MSYNVCREMIIAKKFKTFSSRRKHCDFNRREFVTLVYVDKRQQVFWFVSIPNKNEIKKVNLAIKLQQLSAQ